MPAVKLSPLFNGQTVTSAGAPASGYKVYTYAAGSSSELATYTTSSGATPQANPIVLNANGYPANPIWLQSGLSYKFILKDANDVQVGSPWDNITGVNDTSGSTSQWQASSATPTYVSATSFTLAGDQTTDFHVGRRVQATVTAGTVYGIITSSTYSTSTTVVVQMDSGQSLDSGLTAVNLSILRADHLAIPSFVTANTCTRGLIGSVNAATPLTKCDLSADAVTLRNAAGALTTRFSTGSLTCDLGLAGPAANGRDQSAAFTANSWVYLYFIWNGTTLATLASTTAPASFTGSTLPTGYTHWAFATALRWNASSNIIPAYAKGASVFYDIALGGVNRVLSAGQATTMTAVSMAGFVPPVASRAHANFLLSVVHNVAGADFQALYRPTGATQAGILAGDAICQVSGVQVISLNSAQVVVGTSQQIDYKISAAPATSGGVYIDVLGFTVPNGDA